MTDNEQSYRSAWQPLTFKGVALFAQAPFSRLLTVQLVVAVAAAGSALSFFLIAWKPVFDRAILKLPKESIIRNGRLEWRGPDPMRLAENVFLAIGVAQNSAGALGASADVQLEFGNHEFRFRSILGYIAIPYPRGWTVSMNRQAIEPWWGAWHLLLLSGAGLGIVLGLLITWGILATLYAWPVRLIAFYADRETTVPGSWRLASAALMPGAALMSLSILAYGLQRLSLLQLILSAGLHFAIGWLFVLVSPFCLPRERKVKHTKRRRNPFSEKRRSRSK